MSGLISAPGKLRLQLFTGLLNVFTEKVKKNLRKNRDFVSRKWRLHMSPFPKCSGGVGYLSHSQARRN